jgi:wyosine [tRNA(Phe)-imidazoG37] synthetase (radical SAM superfamily)
MSVQERVREVRQAGERIDYLTFVPDGEPTLDVNLAREIGRLRLLDIKIAVISNSSLIWRHDVRHDLRLADWVSLKVDSVDEEVWRRINRPHGSLRIDSIMQGMTLYAESKRGELVTETMLVRGINDGYDQLSSVAEFVATLRPRTHYLAIPTRPPAEEGVAPPDEQTLNLAFQVFSDRIPRVELLVDYEGTEFAATGSVERDLLGVIAVHPMREDAVRELLGRDGAEWSAVEKLLHEGLLQEAWHRGDRYFMRRTPGARKGPHRENLAG